MTSPLLPTLLLALTLPLAAQAPQPEAGRGHQAPRRAQLLNLSPAQQSSIQAIREKQRPELLLRREALRSTQLALGKALRDSAATPAQLRPLYDQAASARFDLLMARRATHQAVLAQLSPEQREQAAELRGQARGRRGRGPSMGMGR